MQALADQGAHEIACFLARRRIAVVISRKVDERPAAHHERGPSPLNGAVNRTRSGALVVRGRTLIDLAADDYSDPATREEARHLMRALIGERLHGQVLHTRAVLRELSDL